MGLDGVELEGVPTAEGFALAITRKSPAMSALDIHILDPLRRKSEPSGVAVVFKENASEPAADSVRAKLPI